MQLAQRQQLERHIYGFDSPPGVAPRCNFLVSWSQYVLTLLIGGGLSVAGQVMEPMVGAKTA